MKRPILFKRIFLSCVFSQLLIQIILTDRFIHSTIDTSELEVINIEKETVPRTPLQLEAQRHLAGEIDTKIPKTLGAFLHVGKTAGSTLSKLLRNGCHSFAKKPCLNNKELPPSNEMAISKLTTYYHIPDFDDENLLKNHEENPYDFFVLTMRDPLSRAISAYASMHPYRKAWEMFLDYETSNPTLYRHYLRNYGAKVSIINRIIAVKKFELAKIYNRCFSTLEEYAQLLTNFTNYEPNDVKTYLKKRECDNVAKTTLHHVDSFPIAHNYWDLRQILFQVHKDLKDKTLLVIRKESLWQDWTSANLWLGEEKVGIHNQTSSTIMRNSTELDLPINMNLSIEGRRNLCLALEDEYRLYLRVLMLSSNLSKDDMESSLAIAQTNCPWLNLTLPAIDHEEVFVMSQSRGEWKL